MSTHHSPIASVSGREILDSRGNPTVEVVLSGQELEVPRPLPFHD